MLNRAFVVAALVAGSSLASAQFVFAVDSGNDVVHLMSAVDGSLVQQDYIDIAAAAAAEGYTGGLTPREIIEVGNELWVTDQVADRVFRFNRSTGAALGSIGAGVLDNIRGIEVVGNTVYIAQGSSATFNAGVVTYSLTSNTFTGSFNNFAPGDTSYQDVLFYNGELLVSDSATDRIIRYALDGSFLGLFASSDGVTDFDFVQQMTETSDGGLLASGFSLPAGVYGFDSSGNALGIVAGLNIGPRGAVELLNGQILYSGGINLRTDAGVVLGGTSAFSFQYLTLTSVPAPGVAAGLALGLGLAARRRR